VYLEAHSDDKEKKANEEGFSDVLDGHAGDIALRPALILPES